MENIGLVSSPSKRLETESELFLNYGDKFFPEPAEAIQGESGIERTERTKGHAGEGNQAA